MNETTHEGGCLCGGVRYAVAGPIGDIGHCHCSMCRRAAGAVVVTWLTVPPARFAVTRGSLKTWRSSPDCERGFCPDCGCQITFFDDRLPGEVNVTVASLDAAADFPPAYHGWAGSRLPWLHLDPHLPQSPESVSLQRD